MASRGENVFVRELPQLVESALPGFPDASLKEDGDAGWPIASYPQPMDPVNLDQRLSQFTEHWQPRTIAQLNDQDIMVVKAKGEFVWHKHDDTDDFFLVQPAFQRNQRGVQMFSS